MPSGNLDFSVLYVVARLCAGNIPRIVYRAERKTCMHPWLVDRAYSCRPASKDEHRLRPVMGHRPSSRSFKFMELEAYWSFMTQATVIGSYSTTEKSCDSLSVQWNAHCGRYRQLGLHFKCTQHCMLRC